MFRLVAKGNPVAVRKDILIGLNGEGVKQGIQPTHALIGPTNTTRLVGLSLLVGQEGKAVGREEPEMSTASVSCSL